jgi:hypothetical protein
MSRVLWVLAALLFLAVALVAWIQVGPTLNPEAALVAPLDADCDLRKGPCGAVFPGGGQVSFEISPRQIPVLEKLELRVRTKGVDARGVEVDFSGVDMNMGFNRVTLAPTGSGEFSGSGMLPVCVRARMRWEAKVLLHMDAGLMSAPFRFDAYRPDSEPSAATSGANPG